MRMQKYKCDECGELLPEYHQGIWLKTFDFEYEGNTYQVPRRKEEFIDFCSVPCMMKWLTKETSKMTENGKRK